MQQPYAFAPPPPKKSNTVAIVLVIVGGVVLLGVAVIGVLAVLAISGTRKYVAAAKTAEARNTVGEIARDATAAYEREDIDLKTGAIAHKLCPAASHPVPSSISDVRGKKYMSSPTDWTDDSAKNAGFYCLKFEMMTPQYYQYDYRVSGKSFTVEGKGDLDGDGDLSSFTVTGTIGAGDMVTLGAMKETNGEE
jgi:type IV pilus assembly protein PilA